MCGVKRFWVLFSFLLISVEHYENVVSIEVKGRIISGGPASPAQYPWQVALKKVKHGPLHGSGSIISSNWILTAAHCLVGLRSIHITMGTIFWKNRHALTMVSMHLYPHPGFLRDTFHNDIGLIKLHRPLSFTSRIRPITLVTRANGKNDLVGERGIITGFGYVSTDAPNGFGDLLQAAVKIIPNEECAESFEENVIESTICTIGGDSNESICDGDSGGPLITRDRQGNEIQVGVISFSADISCTDNYPAGYARISSYLDYISQVTNITFP